MLLLRHSSVGIMYIAAALLMHPLALNFFFPPVSFTDMEPLQGWYTGTDHR